MSPRVNGHTRPLGLLGYPVEHSLGPLMHNAAFEALGLNYCYLPLPVAPEALGQAIAGLAAMGFVGANVTFPHKQAVMSYLDELSPDAQAIGAINTIVFREGKRLGYNVDGIGFLAGLTSAMGLPVQGQRILVMGAGGAARAAVYTLVKAGASVTVLNRTVERAQTLVESLRPHLPAAASLDWGALTREAVADRALGADIILNTTSSGMLPNVEATPWPEGLPFPPSAVAYDMIYAPRETTFLRTAKAAGARTLNGLNMLVHQGVQCFRLWTGQQPPLDVMFAAVTDQGVTY